MALEDHDNLWAGFEEALDNDDLPVFIIVDGDYYAWVLGVKNDSPYRDEDSDTRAYLLVMGMVLLHQQVLDGHHG